MSFCKQNPTKPYRLRIWGLKKNKLTLLKLTLIDRRLNVIAKITFQEIAQLQNYRNCAMSISVYSVFFSEGYISLLTNWKDIFYIIYYIYNNIIYILFRKIIGTKKLNKLKLTSLKTVLCLGKNQDFQVKTKIFLKNRKEFQKIRLWSEKKEQVSLESIFEFLRSFSEKITDWKQNQR